MIVLEYCFGLMTQLHWAGSTRFHSRTKRSVPPESTTGELSMIQGLTPRTLSCWRCCKRIRDTMTKCKSDTITCIMSIKLQQTHKIAKIIEILFWACTQNLGLNLLTFSVISEKGWAGLAHSICLLLAVSMSQMDTSLFPLTAEMREDGWVGWAHRR